MTPLEIGLAISCIILVFSCESTMNDFLSSELYLKRSLLIQLLIFDDKSVNKYLAYFLYDILSNFNKDNVKNKDWNAYRDYSPENVMKIFKELIQ